MHTQSFRERLLAVMDKKVHWSWPGFTGGLVPKAKMLTHFQQEYATYVRDFPVLVGWAYVQCPEPQVRRELAENIYEEETGGIAAGKPHPELFLEYPKGLGFSVESFKAIKLLPEAAAYRAFLDHATQTRGWEVALAITTIFVEGSSYERGELDPEAPKRPEPPLEQHPLVVHYGLPIEALALTRAHRKVEGSHRAAAWQCVLEHVATPQRGAVIASMEEALARWQTYRDAVAHACGIVQNHRCEPELDPVLVASG